MCALRRVEDERAGPTALGILVPPARRTFVIVRPRGLAWDLLLVGEAGFREMERSEAHFAAQQVFRGLEEWAAGGPGRIDLDGLPGEGFHVRVLLGTLALVACAREPGHPYRPAVFAEPAAREAAGQLLAVLRPGRDVDQEVYFNTRHFR
jgi:hypothetical protein